jgi:hypothetical protein
MADQNVTVDNNQDSADELVLMHDEETVSLFKALGLPLIKMNKLEAEKFENYTAETREQFFVEYVQKTMGYNGQHHMFNGRRGEREVTLPLKQILKIICATYIKLVDDKQNVVQLNVPTSEEIQEGTLLKVEEQNDYLDSPVMFINMVMALIEQASDQAKLMNKD